MVGFENGSQAFIRKVALPPRQSIGQAGKEIMDELKPLFVDNEDPFRKYRGKSFGQQMKVWLFGTFPILSWVLNYKLSDLPGDIIGGLTITSLAVPQDLAYAGNLAKLPPVTGLYTSFTTPLIYAIFGSSKHIAIGPVAVVSLLLGSELGKVYDYQEDRQLYYELALVSTLFAGILQLGLGLFRLGFIIDFLSDSAIIGFMAGAAITIGLQQLKGWFNYGNNCKKCKPNANGKQPAFTTATDIINVSKSLREFQPDFSWQSFVLGLIFFVYLVGSRQLAKRYKKLLYVQATAPLVSVVIATIFTYFQFCDRGKAFKYGKDPKDKTKVVVGPGTCKDIRVVGHIKKGINPFSFSELHLAREPAQAWRVAFIAGLVALTELVAIGRTFAALKGYRIDGNKELVAAGLMNIAGSVTSCYVSTGSFSRSAVNFQSGGNTQLTGIIMALVVLFTLLVLTPLFKYLPQTILSMVILMAVISLIEPHAAYRVYKTDKLDFLILIATFLGTILISVEIGLLLAVALSLLKVILQFTRPKVPQLGLIPGTDVYRNLQQYPEAVPPPGLIVLRVDSPINFANANYVKETVLNKIEILEEEQHQLVQFAILDVTPTIDVDVTAINALEELHKTLKARGVQLVLSNPSTKVLQKFQQSGFLEQIGGNEWLFVSTAEAVRVTSTLVSTKTVSDKNLSV